MTLQKIEFEYDIPDGYRFVRLGKPKKGETILSVRKIHVADFDYSDLCSRRRDYIIIEKIPEQEQSAQNPKRHKHADLICAWANGAKIQYFSLMFSDWHDIDNPSWDDEKEYRIKPKTKTVRFRNFIDNDNKPDIYHEGECLYNFKQWLGDWQEAEVEE